MLVLAQCLEVKFAADPFPGAWRRSQRAGALIPVLVAVSLCVGIGLGIALSHRAAKPTAAGQPQIALSASTTDVLARLTEPIEMRFYSVLDPNAAPDLRDFSRRVIQLLEAYRQASGGKLLLNAQTNANANDALADGIKGFDLNRGEGPYIGLVLVAGSKEQVLPQLSPAWEQALEADISRALTTLTQTPKSQANFTNAIPSDAGLVEAVQQQIPNLGSVSLEEGTRVLREASLKEFSSAVAEMQGQVREAQERLTQAKSSGSQPDQDAAMKQLQAVQTANAQKLKDIAANSQARIDTLKKLKAGAK